MKDFKIMVVDDEVVILESIKDYFEEYDIHTYHDPLDAVRELRSNYYDIIIGDYKMPHLSGLDLFVEAKKHNAYNYGILLTAYADKDLLEKFINRGLINKIIEKPLDLELVKTAIHEGLADCADKREKEAELTELKQKYEAVLKGVGYLNEEIIGIEGGLKPVFDKIKSIGGTDENILITGETGTGKEVIARAIHSLSARKEGPFIKINCGAVPESLIESELFGYKKGAFSGAYADKPGRIELADGGSLFLDEIAELRPEMQTKLLHVVQEKKLERLGSNRSIAVDFRLIAATNRDLRASIKGGLFREDLYYRIGTFHLHLPPLRDRVEDLKPLVEYLIGKYRQELDRSDIFIGEAALARLKEYSWPGNIRELENVIKRAVILLGKNEHRIKGSAFDYLFGAPREADHFLDRSLEIISQELIDKSMDLKAIERQILNRVLQRFGGNVMEAVRNTGIPKDRFYRNK